MSKTLKWVPLLALMLLGACVENTTDQKQQEQNEQMIAEAHSRVGMPNIVNFTERRLAKTILELRDDGIATFTYIVDMNGRLHFFCESIGYGLPYSVQFTNPEQVAYEASAGRVTLPQADPNGLYMPEGLDATWIICANENGDPMPVYSEPKIVVTPFPLPNSIGGPTRN